MGNQWPPENDVIAYNESERIRVAGFGTNKKGVFSIKIDVFNKN